MTAAVLTGNLPFRGLSAAELHSSTRFHFGLNGFIRSKQKEPTETTHVIGRAVASYLHSCSRNAQAEPSMPGGEIRKPPTRLEANECEGKWLGSEQLALQWGAELAPLSSCASARSSLPSSSSTTPQRQFSSVKKELQRVSPLAICHVLAKTLP